MPAPLSARDKLLDAAVRLIREQGFAGTSVDALCLAAGVTKGAFFHHFATKEALGVATADRWTSDVSAFFTVAPIHDAPDPAQRVLDYVRFRRTLLDTPVAQFSCVVGTMVQEAFGTSRVIRDACATSIFSHVASLVPDIQRAMTDCRYTGPHSAESLAEFIQGSMQGAFIMAKATGNGEIAERCYDHLSEYLTLLFRGGERA